VSVRVPVPVSERIARLSGYVPGEQPRDTRLVKLNTNENPYPPSPRVEEALARAAAGGLNRYPSPMADALRDAAAALYGIAPEQVLAGNGSDELLAMCMRACLTDGDRVAYAVPSYSLYRTLAALHGAQAIEVATAALPPRERFPIPDALASSGAKVIFVCNPNSPFGAPVARADIARLCASTDALVVSDEAYVDFGGESALAILAEHPNLIVLRTFSKSFSLAGLRLGLAFGSAPLMAELAKVKDSYNVSRLAIAAGVAALEDAAWMRANVERVCATRERVIAALRAAGHVVAPSAANFFWLECAGETGAQLLARLRAKSVLVRYFDEPRLRTGVRVTVGTDAEMDRFLEATLSR
jgi:histidinol-phosphate aminotransferase